ncbi:MAG: hypothetical protein K1X71_14895 [Pirellulales bacterium]|nr:hypothetical protein [Pirellulales bacterium]
MQEIVDDSATPNKGRLKNATRRILAPAGITIALLVVASAISLFVRAPYLASFFGGDDWDLLCEIGLYRCGRQGLLAGWLSPEGPHLMALWKAFFHLEWLLFGLRVEAFHVVIALVHACSAVLLFGIARRWGVSAFGSIVMSLTWAGAAFGGWDNPTLWLMCGMAPMALCFLFLSLWFAIDVDSPRRRDRWWMASFLGLAMLTWSDMVLLAPVIMLQVALRLGPRETLRRARRWIAAWLVPVVLIGLPTAGFVAIILQIASAARPADRFQDLGPRRLVSRTSCQLAVAMGSLTYGTVREPDLANSDLFRTTRPAIPDEALAPKFAIAGAMVLALLLLRQHVQWGYLANFVALSGVFLFAANAGGKGMSFHDAINHGHYLYFACLLCCVSFGVLADGLWMRYERCRIFIVVIAVMLAPLFLAHQRQVAVQAAAIHRLMFDVGRVEFKQSREILERLSLAATQKGAVVRFPDSPIDLQAPSHRYWPIAAFYSLCFPAGLPNLEVIDPAEATTRDLEQAVELLRGQHAKYAVRWASLMVAYYPVLKSLVWLNQVVDAHHPAVAIPNIEVTLASASYQLEELAELGIGATANELRFQRPTANDPPTLKREFPAFYQILQKSNQPEAKYLLAVIFQEK